MKKECWYFSICPQNKFQVKSNLKTQTEKLIFKKILELFFSLRPQNCISIVKHIDKLHEHVILSK